jgi:hypothetical protein
MRGWPDVLARVQRFFPARVRVNLLRVFVVANGHPWGDAYVRGVSEEGDVLRLWESGEPVTVLNAVLIASGYRGDAAAQADKALGVLSHEVFHAFFRRYRAQTPAWAQVTGDLAPRVALQVLVLNEGVAHFVDRGTELLRDGFPSERADAALGRLAGAWERLAHAEGPEAEEILRAADQGPYWDKYGSIGGMLITYGVYRAFGLEGVRDALRCGPGRLLSRYQDAAARVSGLPELPENLNASRWIDLCRAERPY